MKAASIVQPPSEMRDRLVRVLFVTNMFPNERNIQQGIFVWELANAVKSLGHDIRVVSIEPVLAWPFNKLNVYQHQVANGEVPAFDCIIRHEVIQFPRNIGVCFRYRAWAAVLLKKIETMWPGWRPNIVHSHTLIPGGLVAREMCGKLCVAHVSTSHGADTRVHMKRCKTRAAIKRMLSQGHYVVGVGQPVVDALRPLAKYPDRIRRIYNGVNIDTLRPANVQLRQRFARRRIILGMGNLVKTKGFDLLIRAFAAVAGDFPAWDLVIVGGGVQWRNLVQAVRQLDLAGRVHFTGPLPHAEAMEWMELCDIFCLPSWSEGLGIVYLEAMACGKPVIGVTGQGIDPIIRENATGLLTEPKSIDSLVSALRRLMMEDMTRMQMGRAGKELIHENFTWDMCARQYVKLYCEILGEKNSNECSV